jgi:hypothetical protein
MHSLVMSTRWDILAQGLLVVALTTQAVPPAQCDRLDGGVLSQGLLYRLPNGERV